MHLIPRGRPRERVPVRLSNCVRTALLPSFKALLASGRMHCAYVPLLGHCLHLQRTASRVCAMASSSASHNPKRQRSPESFSANKKSAGKVSVAAKILAAEKTMSDELEKMKFSSPVSVVYNPLEYAWAGHKWFVEKYGNSERKVLLVGMNPGPWGMAQTGVPFGQVDVVKHWMEMPEETEIRKPAKEHPKREVLGLSTTRSEVSGTRLWKEWAETSYGSPNKFFETFFVHCYCPLMFMESSGRNRTPDKLPAAKRKQLLEICDAGLLQVIEALKPSVIAGVGVFAAKRCQSVVHAAGKDNVVRCGTLLHPSPASPLANGGKWIGTFKNQLDTLLKE